MTKVQRHEVLSKGDYDVARNLIREQVMKQKELRRVHLGDYLTFLFENHDTVLYQIQEMIRAENHLGDREIQHEIDTYNELVGAKGELGCTLLIEIESPEKRDVLLSQWLDLPSRLYIKTQSGKRIPAQFDPRQIGERRISSVHYLKFALGDQVPSHLGSSHPGYELEVELRPEQVTALLKDLVSS